MNLQHRARGHDRGLCALTFAALVVLAGASEAGAAPPTHVCAQAQPDNFLVDGRLDDWHGFRGTGVQKRSRDRAFVLRCAYDAERIYLSVNVRDERVIRTRRARAGGEDSLTLRLNAPGGKPLRLRAFPGSRTAEPKRVGAPGFVAIEDSLQDWGLSFEASVELSRLAQWSRSTPALTGEIVYHDADKATERRIQDRIRFRGRLLFAGAWRVHRAFMRQLRLDERDVRLDVLADVDPGVGPERVIAAGRFIGVLSDRYTYLQLPVKRASDVIEVKVADLAGEGRSTILAQYRQRGSAGSRDLVTVWQVSGEGKFQALSTFEVRLERDGKRVENRWSLVPKRRGKKRRRRGRGKGLDIKIEAADAVGFTRESYQAIPAGNARPILLPWSEPSSVTYRYEGGALVPLDGK